jgi:hypothetical protein
LWIGIIGYGVLYAGVMKLGGGKCTLRQAFTGQCVPSSTSTQGTTGSAQSGQSGLQTNPLPAAGDTTPGGGSW